MFFAVLILSVSLSMDSLFLGIAYGIKQTKIPLFSKLLICFFSILYAIAAIMLGSSISSLLPKESAKIVGAVILAMIGMMMLRSAFKKGKEKAFDLTSENNPKTIFRLFIKSFGITIEVLKNPQAGDIDRSGTIDLKEAFLLGLALSLDSFGTGIGSALSGIATWYLPITIGFFQLIFLSLGLRLGKKFSINKEDNLFKIIPGMLILVLLLLRIFS